MKFSLTASGLLFLVTGLLCTTAHSQVAANLPDQNGAAESWWSSQPKETKLLYTNLGAIGAIALYGLAEWDYGSGSLSSANERWFQQHTKYGGADKLGHFWGTYVFSDVLSSVYQNYGYPAQQAGLYGAFSAWVVQAFMELGDATSPSQGFSWEDMVANSLGAATSMLMHRYPELDRKIDFRIEYVLETEVNGLFDDYSNHYYSLVVKLDGFHEIPDNFFRYLEFHIGYYTRGYSDQDEANKRALYTGISFNFSKLFSQAGMNRAAKTLEYLQVPYTVAKARHVVD
ncbi:MAG: DUF2279 domain-containing protein [Desulforhopalus sp.]|jgi:hypothetical protein|nr:DUF2279 domain-containing protein [Desulforhopalus sp.]